VVTAVLQRAVWTCTCGLDGTESHPFSSLPHGGHGWNSLLRGEVDKDHEKLDPPSWGPGFDSRRQSQEDGNLRMRFT
jgi:hypothetical protein